MTVNAGNGSVHPMITTIIFDLDGLLADTEKLHWRAYQEALQAHGAVLTESDYVEHWVRAGKGIGDWVAQRGLSLDPLALRAHKSKRYLELLATELRPMAGALELLEKLRGKKNAGAGFLFLSRRRRRRTTGPRHRPLFSSRCHRTGRGAREAGAGYLSRGSAPSRRHAVSVPGVGRRGKGRTRGP